MLDQRSLGTVVGPQKSDSLPQRLCPPTDLHMAGSGWQGKGERGCRLITENPLGLDIWLFVETLDNKWNMNHEGVELDSQGRVAVPLHQEGH